MNKQIKELAIKAGLIAPYGSDLEGLREFDYRMFAELIVGECMRQVEEQYKPVLEDTEMMMFPHWDGYVQCGVDSYVAIREHFFGVEL